MDCTLKFPGENGRQRSRAMFSQSRPMYYVYLIESVATPYRHYVGFTEDLRRRLVEHNDGKLPTTAPYRPCLLKTYLGFSSKKQALSFEKYLKSGSGHAFANKRLW